jgi:hypothetical protein
MWHQLLSVLQNQIVLGCQCLLFLILNILDGHSTWLVLKPDFYHRERNPIARWVFKKLRLPRAIPIFKAVLLSLLGWVIIHWWKDALTLNIAMTIGNALFIYVVIHNYRVFRHYHQIVEQDALS